MKKVFALTAISIALLGAGCSSDDDDDDDAGTTDGMTDGMTDGATDGGAGPTMAVLPAGADFDITAIDPVPTQTLAEVAGGVPTLSTLVSTVANNCPDILTALGDPEARLTVFAPTDEAFGAQAVTDALAAPDADVCAVVAGHVLTDTVAGSTALAGQTGTVATTLAGTTVAIEVDADGGLTIGGAPVFIGDNFATNGVAHIISAVILPMADEGGETGGDTGMEGTDTGEGGTTGGDGTLGPVATAFTSAPALSTFVEAFNRENFTSALDGAGGDGTPNTWTVFAPSNEALTAASVGAGDLTVQDLQRHIFTNGSLGTEGELAGASPIVTTSGLGTYDVVTLPDGSVTVGGFPVTLVTTGQSTVYQIEGVLP